MWKKISFFNVSSFLPTGFISHAQLPTALVLNDKVRVFFASRNEKQFSSVFYVDIVIDNTRCDYYYIANNPILEPGGVGCFDWNGVYPSSIVEVNKNYFLYYIGWTQGIEAPLFYASIGLAISSDGSTFKKYSISPILDRSMYDPCLVTSPNVFIDNNIWKMTYVSGLKWVRNKYNNLQSYYHIKYAESVDGINWVRDGRIAIDLQDKETNVARSSVLKINNGFYKMWFSYVDSKINKYRIGYAESVDSYNWIRNDSLAGITVDTTHAQDMLCYPNVFKWEDDLYMLYNGDSYGKLGFCLAIWVD